MRHVFSSVTLTLAVVCGLRLAVGPATAGEPAVDAAAMYVPWGHPAYTQGDECRYPWPDWGVAAFRLGGEWRHELPAWSANPAETNALCLEFDRAALRHNLTLLLWCSGAPASVGLFDADGSIVAGDMAGISLYLEGDEKLMLYALPLQHFPAAVGILLGNCGALDVFGALLVEERDVAPAPQPAAGAAVPSPAGASAASASGDGLTPTLSGTRTPTPTPTIAASPAQVPGLSQAAYSASQDDSLACSALHIHAPHSGARILW